MLRTHMKQNINILLKNVKNENLKDPKASIECSNDMQDIYKNIEV